MSPANNLQDTNGSSYITYPQPTETNGFSYVASQQPSTTANNLPETFRNL